MKQIKKFSDFINEELVAVGFGPSTLAPYSIGSGYPTTGYSMTPISFKVDDLGSSVANEALAYEGNENPDHTAESYLKEAKKYINDKLDEIYESSCGKTNEAMVQVAGNKKPSGAKVLASVIVDKLEEAKVLKPGTNINAIKDAVQMIIMDSTF